MLAVSEIIFGLRGRRDLSRRARPRRGAGRALLRAWLGYNASRVGSIDGDGQSYQLNMYDYVGGMTKLYAGTLLRYRKVNPVSTIVAGSLRVAEQIKHEL